MSRAYLCAQSAIDWDNATEAQRNAAIACSRQALIGSDLTAIHAARRTKDPSLPEYESLTAAEIASLELQAATVVTVGASEYEITANASDEGPGVTMQTDHLRNEGALAVLAYGSESSLEDPAQRQLWASWFTQKS